MKQPNTKFNFENNTITAFRKPINLIVMKSVHYVIPITNSKCILNKLSITDQHITLSKLDKSDKDIAIKLHRQFAHPTSNKLTKLLNIAGQE